MLGAARHHRSIRPLLHSRSDGLCPLPLSSLNIRPLRIKFAPLPPSPPPLPFTSTASRASALLLPATTLFFSSDASVKASRASRTSPFWPPFWPLEAASRAGSVVNTLLLSDHRRLAALNPPPATPYHAHRLLPTCSTTPRSFPCAGLIASPRLITTQSRSLNSRNPLWFQDSTLVISTSPSNNQMQS